MDITGRPSLLIIGAFCAVALAAAACGDDDNESPSTTPAVQATAARASTAVATSTPVETTNRMTSQVFKPGLSVGFREGEVWTPAADVQTMFAVEHAPGTNGPDAGYVAIFRVSQVRNPDNPAELQPPPDDFIGWLTAHPSVAVTGDASEVVIAGMAARQVDVRFDTTGDVLLFDDVGWASRERARFIELTVDGERLVLAAGPFDQVYFEEFSEFFEPVISSMRLE
jgi:hypothetical protein